MSQAIETYTPQQLADNLGIPSRIILSAIKSGQLRAIRYTAKTIRIRSEDAARWVSSLTK